MPAKTADAIVAEVGSNKEFRKIVAREAIDNPGISLQKYLNFEAYIRAYYGDAVILGLDKPPARSVLDIGTGVGYFPYLCSSLGNIAAAIDVDDYPVYNQTTAALGVERYVHRVEAFESIPIMPRKFDLITSFAICFNHHKEPGLWGSKEWTFFLLDLINNHLVQNGKIFLRFNREEDGHFGSKDIPLMLQNMGATISDMDVRFENAETIRRYTS